MRGGVLFMAISGPPSLGRQIFLRLFRWRIILRSQQVVAPSSVGGVLRRYFNKTWLLALLVGVGLTLTGLIHIWLGFVLLFLALALFFHDFFRFIQRRVIRQLATWTVVVVVLLICWRPMIRYVASKQEP